MQPEHTGHPLQILIIGLNYAPEVTGIAPYTTGLSEDLASRGHRVKVITGLPHYPAWRVSSEHRNLPQNQAVNSVSLHRTNHYVPNKPTPFGRIRLEASFALRAVLTKWGHPDVIICVSPSLLASAAAVLKAKTLRRRSHTALWIQDIYSKGIAETTAAPSLLARIVREFESVVVRSADHAIVIHDRFKATVESLLRMPARRVHVVRNWSHVQIAPPEVGDGNPRVKFNWRSEDTIVLHAGNMGAKQGLENVVEAARLAEKRRLPIRFVLLGDGNQRGRLEQLANGIQNLEFCSTLSDEDFHDALRAADILLLNEKGTVKDMAVPSKLTTYFAAHKPVLAATSETSASADELRASNGGVIVAPDNPDDLLEATINLRADPEYCEELAKNGSQYRDQNLTHQAALDSMDQILTEMMNGGKLQ